MSSFDDLAMTVERIVSDDGGWTIRLTKDIKRIGDPLFVFKVVEPSLLYVTGKMIYDNPDWKAVMKVLRVSHNSVGHQTAHVVARLHIDRGTSNRDSIHGSGQNGIYFISWVITPCIW